MRRLIIGALVLSSLAGCAIGRRHAYHGSRPTLHHAGPGWIAVAVQDHRREVVSGDKEETFVGFSRGGYGNKFDIVTVSGRTLAADFADTICHGLIAKQYRVTYVQTSPRQAPQEVVSALARTGAPRLLVVEIREWKSDTYNSTDLEYDVAANVLDNRGTQLAVAAVRGEDALGSSFLDPAGYAETVIPPAYLDRLQRLLNQPTIGPALRSAPPPPPLPASTPATTTAPPSS